MTQPAAKQLTQEALSFLGTFEVPFTFQNVKGSHTDTQPIQNPPAGLQVATIALQAFNIEYANGKQFGYGKFQVDVSVDPNRRNASCRVTLKDDTDNRVWDGTARALVTFFGKP
ncbi:MAG TPA: hypothetical protein VN493_10660 [Thermoanaerobaculia bacterium]|nr:hypothetical protein [Thermoanaerobaculia bacterium]